MMPDKQRTEDRSQKSGHGSTNYPFPRITRLSGRHRIAASRFSSIQNLATRRNFFHSPTKRAVLCVQWEQTLLNHGPNGIIHRILWANSQMMSVPEKFSSDI
jgi:hypothetical protein